MFLSENSLHLACCQCFHDPFNTRLVVYDPKALNPPPAFIFMEMLHDVITYEKCLLHPLHPHQIHDIVVELRGMFCTMRTHN